MINPCQIKILPSAEECLLHLADALREEGYSPRHIEKFINEIVDNIVGIPNKLCHVLPPVFRRHLGLRGNLWYVSFKRKSSHLTTWYVVFEKRQGQLLVLHITNNWFEGHYIR